jgi:hypothetical protein
MDIEWLIPTLEYHLDLHGISEIARIGCQYHGVNGVLKRTRAGWQMFDTKPRDPGGFIPSGAAIGEASSRAVRALKGLGKCM